MACIGASGESFGCGSTKLRLGDGQTDPIVVFLKACLGIHVGIMGFSHTSSLLCHVPLSQTYL